MKKLIKNSGLALALALAVLFSALPAQAMGSFEGLVGQVHRRVEKHWPHMDQVWPGLDYTRHNLVLFHVDDELKAKDAWLVSATEKRQLSAEEYKDLTLPQPGGYGSLTFQGKPSISISLDDYSVKLWGEDEQTFRTATHELVHFYYQNQINQMGSGGRAQVYPVDAQPRYYRQMIFQRLIKAFEDPAQREDSLSKARHWLNKWQEEYPEEAEAIRLTDLVEGGAQYVENMGAMAGEGASGEAFDQLAAKSIQREELFPSADGESYELGYVAGLLLDKTRPGWKEGIYGNGMSPVEMLLKDVKAAAEPDDPAIKAAVTEDIKEINAIAAEDLADIIKVQADKAISMLKINVKDTSTSYQARGNYLVDGEDVITGLGAQYQAGNGVIDIRGLGAYVQYSEAEGESFVIPLTMSHEVKDSVLNIQSDKLIVDGVKVQETKENGRMVYTVRASDS